MKEKLHIPEVAGKTLVNLCVIDDQTYGREVNLKFTDGTELSLLIAVQQSTTARCLDSSTGDVLFERGDEEAAAPQIKL